MYCDASRRGEGTAHIYIRAGSRLHCTHICTNVSAGCVTSSVATQGTHIYIHHSTHIYHLRLLRMCICVCDLSSPARGRGGRRARVCAAASSARGRLCRTTSAAVRGGDDRIPTASLLLARTYAVFPLHEHNLVFSTCSGPDSQFENKREPYKSENPNPNLDRTQTNPDPTQTWTEPKLTRTRTRTRTRPPDRKHEPGTPRASARRTRRRCTARSSAWERGGRRGGRRSLQRRSAFGSRGSAASM